MPDYRLYCFNGDGAIGNGEWFEAKNDDEAVALTRGKKLHIKCEVWLGGRKVAEVPPAAQP